MRKAVPTVDPQLIIEANNAVFNDKDKSDHAVTMVIHFDGRVDAKTMIAIDYRLVALANIIKGTQRSPWIIDAKGKRHKLVNEAMFRAAAKTPLMIDDKKTVASIAFDPAEFLKHALAEADVEGKA